MGEMSHLGVIKYLKIGDLFHKDMHTSMADALSHELQIYQQYKSEPLNLGRTVSLEVIFISVMDERCLAMK